MSTVDEILEEDDDFSSLSVAPSFTLSDILEEPPDDDIQDP